MRSKRTQLLANSFFHELIEGRLTSADRVLQKVKSEVSTRRWQKGYICALEGMLSALKSRGDRSALINQIRAEETNKLARTFSRHSKSAMQSEFDRGFFTAWIDYVRALKDSM